MAAAFCTSFPMPWLAWPLLSGLWLLLIGLMTDGMMTDWTPDHEVMEDRARESGLTFFSVVFGLLLISEYACREASVMLSFVCFTKSAVLFWMLADFAETIRGGKKKNIKGTPQTTLEAYEIAPFLLAMFFACILAGCIFRNPVPAEIGMVIGLLVVLVLYIGFMQQGERIPERGSRPMQLLLLLVLLVAPSFFLGPQKELQSTAPTPWKDNNQGAGSNPPPTCELGSRHAHHDTGARPPPTETGNTVDDRWRYGRWKYDIFISHAGEDKAFAHRLGDAFSSIGLHAFVDEADLVGGDNADVRMLQAVEEAPIGLAILSKHFFGKRWPVKELKIIVGQTILLPVLYKITHEEATKGLLKSPQAEVYDPQEWATFVHSVERTTAIRNPGTTSNERPFVEFVVYSAVRLSVEVVGTKVAQHASRRVWAYVYVKRLEAATSSMSRLFRELSVKQAENAQLWASKMLYLAEAINQD